MRDGYIKLATCSPEQHLCDPHANALEATRAIQDAAKQGAHVVVLPELYLSGYTAHDLFLQDMLLSDVEHALVDVAAQTADLDVIAFVGMPLRNQAKLYNVAAVISHGKVLGFVPKQALPTYAEFYEARHFTPGPAEVSIIQGGPFDGIPFGTNQIFYHSELTNLRIAAEICEDLWAPNPPSTRHALAGATVIVNLSASNAIVGKADYRRQLVSATSARLICAYAYASAGWGESTQDVVFSGHCLIAENGQIKAESKPFSAQGALSEVDIQLLAYERQRMSTYQDLEHADAHANYHYTAFDLEVRETELTHTPDPYPFVPQDAQNLGQRCEDILDIQAYGLARRLAHTHSHHAVIGISGGLDSTLALLVTARAFDILKLDHTGIIAITMPGFGTTHRTKSNALNLSEALGCQLRDISIHKAVEQHFIDINHDPAVRDVTYENSQARERTQILMDVANQEGGLVIGTGDLSELALGWATYNGDHMSMYGVNASVPKTLVRHLVAHVVHAVEKNNPLLSKTLLDVLDTPVSPELLPADEHGEIAQKTEDLVGPYTLHDFFLYHVLRRGEAPHKVYRLACLAFAGTYEPDFIYRWLNSFYRRFFAQHFKRSVLPDGPKVGSVAVSPRGDLRMPTDARATAWLKDLDSIRRS